MTKTEIKILAGKIAKLKAIKTSVFVNILIVNII